MKLIFIVLLLGNIGFALLSLLGNAQSDSVALKKVEHKTLNNLQTLAERNKNSHTEKKTSLQDIPEMIGISAEKGDGARQCQLIGPFVELLHAEYLVEQLAVLQVSAAIKRVEIMDGKNYWVYLQPEMSEKAALRRLYEIQAKAIDSYIIPSGELANGISFGQFSDEKEAQEKVSQISEQGYSVAIKEIPKSHSEIWVEVMDKSEQKISEEKWLELLKDEKDIERRQNYCLGVAN